MRALILILALSLAAGMWLLRSVHDTGDPVQSRPEASPVVIQQPTVVRPAMTSPPAPVSRGESDAPPERRAADAVSERRDRLQTRFVAQPTDGSWAGSARNLLSDDLAKHTHDDADVRVASVECRTSLCRIELAPASRDAGQRFVETWVRDRTWTGPGFIASQGDSMVVFVGRPGMPESLAD